MRLGVSERTVYRRLKSGKLVLPLPSDVSVHGVNMSGGVMACNVSNESSLGSDSMTKDVSLSVGIVTAVEVEKLRVQLSEKDAQISSLIDSQRELNQTIQRLQDQMFELARLVLVQDNVRPASEGVEKHEIEKPADVPSRGFFSRLFGGHDKAVDKEPRGRS